MLARLNAKRPSGSRHAAGLLARGRGVLVQLGLVLALLWMALTVPATSALAEPAPIVPHGEVRIGTFINRVDGFNLKESRFDVDFYIWFVWSDPDLDPTESWEIVNGSVKNQFLSDEHPVDGGHYAAYRVQASIIKEFDLYKYPLDHHTLTIEIEDGAPVQRLRYIADDANSALSDDFFAPGFTAGRPSFAVRDHVYRTNYGDPDMAGDTTSVYSRFIASFDIERPSAATAWKLYIGVFVAALIGFLGLMARPDHTDVRFGLGSAALFAAIATQFVIASNMPETTILIVPDIICIVTISFVFLTLLQSGIALGLAGRGHEALARRLDWVAMVVLLTSYITICGWLILS
jgi:hypothetical protein